MTDIPGDPAAPSRSSPKTVEPASGLAAAHSIPIATGVPLEAHPPGGYLAEELEARNWTTTDLALRMGGATVDEMARDQLCAELFIAVHDPKLVLDTKMARKLARALGTSEMLWLNLDAGFRWACAQGIEVAKPARRDSGSTEGESPVGSADAPGGV